MQLQTAETRNTVVDVLPPTTTPTPVTKPNEFKILFKMRKMVVVTKNWTVDTITPVKSSFSFAYILLIFHTLCNARIASTFYSEA